MHLMHLMNKLQIEFPLLNNKSALNTVETSSWGHFLRQQERFDTARDIFSVHLGNQLCLAYEWMPGSSLQSPECLRLSFISISNKVKELNKT